MYLNIIKKKPPTSLQIPETHENIWETKLGTYWFEDDFLCLVFKNTPNNLSLAREEFAFLQKLNGVKKVRLLVDSTMVHPIDFPTMEFMDKEIPRFFSKVAVISSSRKGTRIANLFLLVKPQAFKVRYFWDEEEARSWLGN